MLVTNQNDLNDTDRDIQSETWRSRRMVLAGEGVGFSFHDTVIYAGTTSTFHYANHIEAVYCVQGEGTLTNEETGEVHELKDSTMYLLDGHEKHTVRASDISRATAGLKKDLPCDTACTASSRSTSAESLSR